MSSKEKTAGKIGLTNIGNTCFMNSAIQCLIHIPEVRDIFLNIVNINKCEETLVAFNWTKLVCALWDKEETVVSVRPITFYTSFCKYICKKGLDQFRGYGQNDVQEFIVLLLDILHESMKKRCVININGKIQNEQDQCAYDAASSWKSYFQDGYSKVISTFYGQLKSGIIDCDTQKLLSTSYDPICHFNLPIPDIEMFEVADILPDIYDCFELFCEEEELEDRFTYKKEEYTVTKKIDVWKFPSLLMVTFKRFDMMLRKNSQKIEFPVKTLDLTKFCSGYSTNSPRKFNLVGVCNHNGNIRGGHYYSYSLCHDGKWRQFNDKYVSEISENNIVTDAAYVLFYRAQMN
jgi:ubiquitin C-terminal hydrolase